jgi:hypothetical protein
MGFQSGSGQEKGERCDKGESWLRVDPRGLAQPSACSMALRAVRTSGGF